MPWGKSPAPVGSLRRGRAGDGAGMCAVWADLGERSRATRPRGFTPRVSEGATLRRVALPSNEPVLDYAPGSPERDELRREIATQAAQPRRLPLVIGGER